MALIWEVRPRRRPHRLLDASDWLLLRVHAWMRRSPRLRRLDAFSRSFDQGKLAFSIVGGLGLLPLIIALWLHVGR